MSLVGGFKGRERGRGIWWVDELTGLGEEKEEGRTGADGGFVGLLV